jgi:hypothetical protein
VKWWNGTGPACFATGSNIKVTGDNIRRTLTCNLDAEIEELRAFTFDPVQCVRDNRGCYIAAVIVIARAMPLPTGHTK